MSTPSSAQTPGPAPDSSAPGDAAASSPPPLKPLDPPTLPFAVGGMIAWAIAWVVVFLAFRDDHPSWPGICIAGFLIGFPGIVVMTVHDRRRRARRDAAGPSNVG